MSNPPEPQSHPLPLGRRRFLGGLAAGAAAGALGGCGLFGDDDEAVEPEPAPPSPPSSVAADPVLFILGVASGDPTPTSVILWTRLARDFTADGGMGAEDMEVTWEVAADEAFAEVVAGGTARAIAASAHSVHVDATGLDPDRWYWYRFTAGDEASPVGRTRTMPAADSAPERLRLAFASCQDWSAGWYTAYDHLVEEDLDLVLFLGDYIYETAAERERDDAVRSYDAPEPLDLAAYRARYALHRSDPALQAAHGRFPWLVTWDDHEVDNNYAGGDPDVDADRRAAAYQAWFEHQPVRVARPQGSAVEIYRSVRFGDLASFFVLDTRQHRDAQPCSPEGALSRSCDEVSQTVMLGPAQERWLAEGLRASGTVWNVLAQQVVMTPVEVPLGDPPLVNLDQWDGYTAARQRVIDVLAEDAVANPVVLSGDVHAGAVADLHRTATDTSTPAIGTEFVGTSITSPFPAPLADFLEGAAAVLSPFAYLNITQRGYVRCEITRDTWRTDYRLVATVAEPRSELATDASFVVRAGTPGAERL